MWLSTNKGFLSIVTNPAGADLLLVRARRPGEIESIFPGVTVTRTPGRDYLYRASVYRAVVGEALMAAVIGIDYPNFKNSVKDDKLHSAYSQVWHVMSRLQEVPPYGKDAVPAKRKGTAVKKPKRAWEPEKQISMQEFDSLFPK